MNETQIALLKRHWQELLRQLAEQFGEAPDLQGIIFLIGVQELGQGSRKFSKEEKQDLMHIATCRLMSYEGYYELEKVDDEGWSHWKQLKEVPRFSLKEQDLLLKQSIVKYFEENDFDLSEDDEEEETII